MTVRLKSLYPVFIFLFVLGLCSCGDNLVFKVEKNLQNEQWSYQDTLDFDLPVLDTAQLYNLYIEFTHTNTFPSQNIYLKLYTRFPDGKRISRVKSFNLYDVEGNSTGACSGSTCKARILLQDNLYFNQLGNYLLTLEQYTRTNPLPGISAVGLMMEKVEKK